MYDLTVKNALILDGSGDEPYRADLAVKDGVIATVGATPPDGNNGLIQGACKAVSMRAIFMTGSSFVAVGSA